MKIAQIAPLFESVPPRLYGGTERVVSYLTEALVAAGHEVTLFASGDSLTSARLVPCSSEALRLNPSIRDPLPWQAIELEHVRRRADEFDIMHFHIDLVQFPLLDLFAGRALTTLHGRLDLPDLLPFYSLFRDTPLVSISASQRLPMPPVRWLGTVAHGLPADLLRFSPTASGGYLAFLGRISPEKRPDCAIEIAERAGLPLKIAAKVDKADEAYWNEVIKPLIARSPRAEFLGEINEAEKQRFLGDALALLFPIDWPEPFGLVMIEAMACGTPCIANRCGSVPEVLDHGVSGFIVESVPEAVRAVERIGTLPRAGVREAFERRFTAERMAHDYLDLYAALRHEAETVRQLAAPAFLNGNSHHEARVEGIKLPEPQAGLNGGPRNSALHGLPKVARAS
jgi:glycosyltransferase involved in cell wall biosynthesis